MTRTTKNVLIIGDLHEPFCLDEYLDFNRKLAKKYNCKEIIFIGDILDGHAWSYHEHSPDGMSPGDELSSAISRLQRWYKAFPKAKVLYGNHDLLISRKAITAGLSRHFLKDFGTIIAAPKKWEFYDRLVIGDIQFIHGSIGNAIKRAKETRMSTVQGHLHSQSFIEWSVSEKDKIFGMQIGCGIDRHAYSFHYGRDFPKKPVIGSGVILENGRLPIIELMDL
jgi:hypothetical protein